MSPPSPHCGRQHCRQSHPPEWPQLAGFLVDEGVRLEREHVDDPQHPVSVLVVIGEIDVEVVGDALRGDEVVRLVAGRVGPHLVKDDEIDQERNCERHQPNGYVEERYPLTSGRAVYTRTLPDTSSHAVGIAHRRLRPSTPRKSAEKAVCIPQAINVAPGMTIRSVSG